MSVKSAGRKSRSPQAKRIKFSSASVSPVNNQIAALLRQRIIGGQYSNKTGGLPPELTLVEEFNVSRHTVRAALHRLVIDGLIVRQRGTGTTIVQRDLVASTWAINSLDDLIGEFYAANLLFADSVPARQFPEMAKLFGLNKRDALFKVIRLLKSEAGSYAYSTIFTRVEYGSRIPKKLMSVQIFLSLVEEYCGVRATRARQSASAVLAPDFTRDELGVAKDEPLLRLRRVFLSRSGEPITHAEMFCRSDRYVQVVDFSREQDKSK